MKKPLAFEYKGYIGSVVMEDGRLYGMVRNIDDCLIYIGDTLTELEQCFHDSVDEYLDTCKEIGKTPN